MRKIGFLTIALLFIGVITAHTEVIHLKSGQVLEAPVVEKTDSFVKIIVEGVPITLYMDEIESASFDIPRNMDEIDSHTTVDPKNILDKMLGTYRVLTSYVSDVELTHEDELFGIPSQSSGKGKIYLKKPNSYKIELEEKLSVGERENSTRAHTVVWNESSQPFLYLGSRKAYSTIENDKFALSIMSTPTSIGRVGVPQYFFDSVRNDHPLYANRDDIRDLSLLQDETVGGKECYVLEGDLIGLYFKMWIAKDNWCLVKMLSKGASGTSKKEENKILADIEDETEREEMRKFIEETNQFSSESKSIRQITYTNIEINKKISVENFIYTLPAETLKAPSYSKLMRMRKIKK